MKYRAVIRRVIEIEVEFDEEGGYKAARERVRDQIDDFQHMGVVNSDNPKLIKLERVDD